MTVTQIDRGSFTESCSSPDQSVRVVYDGNCVCDIIEGTGKTRTKFELRLYATVAAAETDIASEGWTIGPRAQQFLDSQI